MSICFLVQCHCVFSINVNMSSSSMSTCCLHQCQHVDFSDVNMSTMTISACWRQADIILNVWQVPNAISGGARTSSKASAYMPETTFGNSRVRHHIAICLLPIVYIVLVWAHTRWCVCIRAFVRLRCVHVQVWTQTLCAQTSWKRWCALQVKWSTCSVHFECALQVKWSTLSLNLRFALWVCTSSEAKHFDCVRHVKWSILCVHLRFTLSVCTWGSHLECAFQVKQKTWSVHFDCALEMKRDQHGTVSKQSTQRCLMLSSKPCCEQMQSPVPEGGTRHFLHDFCQVHVWKSTIQQCKTQDGEAFL